MRLASSRTFVAPTIRSQYAQQIFESACLSFAATLSWDWNCYARIIIVKERRGFLHRRATSVHLLLDLLHSSSWRPTFTCSRVWYSSNPYKIPFKIMGKFVDPTSKFCFKSLKHGIMGSVSNLYICWTFVD